jgi:hypothetical protein
MSLPVVQIVRHHGIMQMQQHVNLARRLHPFDEMPTKIVKGLATHWATEWHCKDRPDEFKPRSSAASMNAA